MPDGKVRHSRMEKLDKAARFMLPARSKNPETGWPCLLFIVAEYRQTETAGSAPHLSGYSDFPQSIQPFFP
jgi:hypothetical protein